MNAQSNTTYTTIAKAIEFIQLNFQLQPSLKQIANHVNLSETHFQKLFSEWVGVSPKKFLQYISLEHTKSILQQNKQATLFDLTFDSGLSSTSRLHDLFISIEAMTPGEYKNGGEKLTINYSFNTSPFGKIMVASTHKGICTIVFEEEEVKAFADLIKQFPKALFNLNSDHFQETALQFFQKDWSDLNQIKLHLKGTSFQLKVWESLLKIPFAKLTSYGLIAHDIAAPKASRAVGTAIAVIQ